MNIFKDKSDPVRLQDNEYPQWLWEFAKKDANEIKLEGENPLNVIRREAKSQRKKEIKQKNTTLAK